MRIILALIAAAFCVGQAYAADLTVRVVDAAGAGVSDAVVTFTPAGGAQGPIRFDWPYQVAQHDLTFDPYILIVPAGATVRFPNLDRVRHHVYSFSEGNRFELELFGRDETRSHRFTAAGIAAVGCNIHDQMQAYIVVVETPHVGRSAANGVVVLNGVTGPGELRVWHPNLRVRGGVVSRTLTLPASGAVQERVAVQVRPGGAHPH